MQISSMRQGALAGMIEATIIVRRDTEKSTPITPVDTGNLRASWFVATHMGIADGANPVFKATGAKGRKISPKQLAKVKMNHARVLNDVGADIIYGGSKKLLKCKFGFTANYAVPVHYERRNVTWNRPNSGPYFFSTSLDSKHQEMIRAIQKRAHVSESKININL